MKVYIQKSYKCNERRGFSALGVSFCPFYHTFRMTASAVSAAAETGAFPLRRDGDYQKTIFRLAGDGGKFFSAGYRIADAMAENAFSVLI